jgi:hypothetical protein
MNDWGFVSGRMRALQNNLLGYNTLLRWSEADGADALVRLIKDTPYGETVTESNLASYDSALEQTFSLPQGDRRSRSRSHSRHPAQLPSDLTTSDRPESKLSAARSTGARVREGHTRRRTSTLP